MTSQARVERQRLFSAYRKVFTGKAARVRKTKVIRNIVLKHWSSSKNPAVDPQIDNTISVLRGLLKDRIFESEEKAYKEFPDLSPSSLQTQLADKFSVKREASFEKPVKTELTQHTYSPKSSNINTVNEVQMVKGTEGVVPRSSQASRLSFDTQHYILTKVQQILEESCFRFIEKFFPYVLEKNAWNCAAAIELTKSLTILRKYLGNLPDSCMDTTKQVSFEKIAPVIAQLRHNAVHRVHLRSDVFLKQIHSALVLVEILQDIASTSLLKTLYGQVCASVKKMKYDADVIKQEIDFNLSQLRRQKEGLIQKEQQFLSIFVRQQADIPVAASQELMKSINTLFTSLKPNEVAKKQSNTACIENVTFAHYGVVVEEDDIESDEDLLKAELSQRKDQE